MTMNEQLISSIVGALLIGIGFFTWRYGRNSTLLSTKNLALPVYVALSVIGVATLVLPILTAFRS
jgi:hypothetical protein